MKFLIKVFQPIILNLLALPSNFSCRIAKPNCLSIFIKKIMKQTFVTLPLPRRRRFIQDPATRTTAPNGRQRRMEKDGKKNATERGRVASVGSVWHGTARLSQRASVYIWESQAESPTVYTRWQHINNGAGEMDNWKWRASIGTRAGRRAEGDREAC